MPASASAMLAAREANMPGDTITRAVKKGTGELEGVHYEEVTYEGYGPGGVAVLVECLTDNRHRTAGDVRATFSKGGGNLAAEGSVAWNFHRRGSIQLKPGPTEDQVMEAALEAGADDVVSLGADGFEVRTDPAVLHQVAVALERAGLPRRRAAVDLRSPEHGEGGGRRRAPGGEAARAPRGQRRRAERLGQRRLLRARAGAARRVLGENSLAVRGPC